jgi:Glyoxalase-like domain
VLSAGDRDEASKNRIHVDLTSGDRHREVERLGQLGASIHAEYEDHTLMLYPEGNEFCIADRR